MSTLITFYALENAVVDINTSSDGGEHSVSSELALAAKLAQEFVSNRQKTSVVCATKQQAEAFDEFIWQYPPQHFIPHNLYGEGPEAGTMLEILWLDVFAKQAQPKNRQKLICLSQQVIDNYARFGHIVDFVPVDEEAKNNARMRYKQYKQAGCQLEYKSS